MTQQPTTAQQAADAFLDRVRALGAHIADLPEPSPNYPSDARVQTFTQPVTGSDGMCLVGSHTGLAADPGSNGAPGCTLIASANGTGPVWLGPSYEAAYTASEQLAETVRTVRGGDDLEVMRSRLWLLRCWAATTDPADPAHTRQHVTAAADEAHDRLGRMADLDGIARAAQQIDDTTQRAALLDAALSD